MFKKIAFALMLGMASLGVASAPIMAQAVCVETSFYDKLYGASEKVFTDASALEFIKRASELYKTTFATDNVSKVVVWNYKGVKVVYVFDKTGCKMYGGVMSVDDYNKITQLMVV